MTRNAESLVSIRTKVYEVMNELKRHEQELEKIQNLKDAKIYALDYIITLRDQENERFYNVDASLREELRNRVDALFDSLAGAKADINSTKFQTALTLINTLGSELDSKALRDILDGFQGKMGELHLLERACVVSNVGDAIAVFDDFLFDAGYKEALKAQTSNLLMFSRSFNVTSEILGESVKIEPEDVVKDATRAISNNRFVM